MYDSVYHQTPVCTWYIIFETKLKQIVNNSIYINKINLSPQTTEQ